MRDQSQCNSTAANLHPACHSPPPGPDPPPLSSSLPPVFANVVGDKSTEVRQWVAAVLIPSGGVTVATSFNEPIGMMAFSRKGQFDWIDQLYLHPLSVGRGIGSQLLERAKRELGPRIRLYTFQANTVSRRFFERHGFRPVAFSDGHANEEHCPDVLYELNRNT
jgi:ribosomal protein S18 acetylase RimI-like enzyme